MRLILIYYYYVEKKYIHTFLVNIREETEIRYHRLISKNIV